MIDETSFRSGSFFRFAREQVKILTESDPRTSLPLFKGRVLFINGSKDHRDSERVWEGLCNGRLLVYEGADHFFSHDVRFYGRLLDDLVGFFDE